MTLSRLLPLCLIFLALSCQKKNVAGPAGPQGPAGANGADSLQKGPLQGNVTLYDTTGKPLADNSGATVILENTSPLLKVTTAADGSFTFDNLNEGVYSIAVQKQGFGTTRYFNIKNTGTQPPSRTGPLWLTQQLSSNFDLKALRIDSTNKPNLNFIAILAHPHTISNATLILYVSDSTGVGSGHNIAALNMIWTQPNDSTLTTAPYSISLPQWLPDLTKAGYIYFTAALDNRFVSEYTDEQGNIVTPSTAKPAPQVILNNAQHIY
jgi:hypothetical protein